MYAPLDDNSPALGGGSMDRKLKIRMGNVTETSGESEPALAVTRIEYSTSSNRALVIDRASACDVAMSERTVLEIMEMIPTGRGM